MSDTVVAAPAASEAVVTAPVDGAATEEIHDDGSDLGLTDQPDAAAIEAAAKAGEITKQQAQSMKKKLQLKVNGKTEDVEFDLGDEAALIRELQKSRAFDHTAKEHAQFKSQVDVMMQMLQTDPEGLLEKLGIDVDGLSEKRLTKRVEEMKKTPEQIEQEKMRAELDQLRKDKKAAEEARQTAEQEKARNKAAAEIETDITEALQSKDSFLPKGSPWVARQVGQFMYMAATNGYPNVTAKDVLPLVEQKYREEIAELASGLSEEKMEQLFGKANLDRYRKSVISKKKAGASVPNKPKIEDTGAKKQAKEEKAPEKVPFKNVFNWRS